jgi:uncharacterized protein (TIGR02594 family)
MIAAIGMLVLSGTVDAALAQPSAAQRGHHAKPAHAHAASPQHGALWMRRRAARQTVRESESFLPGFRIPHADRMRAATARRAAAPQRTMTRARDEERSRRAAQSHAAREIHLGRGSRHVRLYRGKATRHVRAALPPEARHVQLVRSTKQAVRANQARTEHAHIAVPLPPAPGGSRASALVAEARRYLGTNPTGRARLWCARFVNFVLDKVGQPGTGSDAAKSFAFYGQRISGPRYGAIAVLTRKGGGHVGIVTGVDRHGNPILIAGNNGKRRVGISVYPKRRVIAYVMPDGRSPAKPKTIRYGRSKNTHYASARR